LLISWFTGHLLVPLPSAIGGNFGPFVPPSMDNDSYRPVSGKIYLKRFKYSLFICESNS